MKYLKTYKLFESDINTQYLYCDDDWKYINDSTRRIVITYDIGKLPELPKNIYYLDCTDCNLTELPTLPQKLEYLICNNNHLSKLPELPETLIHLDCRNNNLTELPKLPKELLTLYFSYNTLEKLPKGISKELLKHILLNPSENTFIKSYALKWIINEPSDYKLLKDCLSDKDKEELNKIHPELLNQDQFGMFGLKESNNSKDYFYRYFKIEFHPEILQGANGRWQIPDLLYFEYANKLTKGFKTVSKIQAQEAIDKYFDLNQKYKKYN